MCNLHWCYTFCTSVILFALVLHLNFTVPSQSESSIFLCVLLWSFQNSDCRPVKMQTTDLLQNWCRLQTEYKMQTENKDCFSRDSWQCHRHVHVCNSKRVAVNFNGWLQENSLSVVHSSKKQETEQFTIFIYLSNWHQVHVLQLPHILGTFVGELTWSWEVL